MLVCERADVSVVCATTTSIVCCKTDGGINMLYHAIDAKIGPTDAVAQVRTSLILFVRE